MKMPALYRPFLSFIAKDVTLVILFFAFNVSLAQEKKDLTIAFSSGVLNSPYYQKANAKDFYEVDFAYQLGGRHVLSANYLTGRHRYFDNSLSNAPQNDVHTNGTNASAEYRTFSVVYKYQIIKRSAISLVPGVGAGILNHTRSYSYQGPGVLYTRNSSWADLVFPVSLDLNVKVSKKWQAGISSGFLVHPDYPVLALHAGPKLSYTIK